MPPGLLQASHPWVTGIAPEDNEPVWWKNVVFRSPRGEDHADGRLLPEADEVIGVTTSARTVLVFTRAPDAEAQAKHLPVRSGAALFESFLTAWQRTARQVGAELLVVTPLRSMATLRRLLPGVAVTSQRGTGFAERVHNAFSLAFERGARAVLMAGGDSPPLGVADLARTFAHLEAHARALVLAPADDGGVNAMGLTATSPRPFARVEWMTGRVGDQLREAARALGLVLFETSSSPDLDCGRDVRSLYRASLLRVSRWYSYRWILESILVAPRAAFGALVAPCSEYDALPQASRGPPSPRLREYAAIIKQAC